MAWASSTLLAEMTAVMIREVLGFHAHVDPTVGGNGASPVFALAGCTDFNDKVNRKCGTQETTIHVSVDSWIGSYASTQNQFAKEYPRLAAEDLGSMGYVGEESMYVSQAILNAAYSESGLALDFYKSYFARLSAASFLKTDSWKATPTPIVTACLSVFVLLGSECQASGKKRQSGVLYVDSSQGIPLEVERKRTQNTVPCFAREDV